MTYYLGCVYRPDREAKKPGNELFGLSKHFKPSIHAFSVQLQTQTDDLPVGVPPEKQHEYLGLTKYRSIFFRPGTNCDLLADDWAIAQKDSMVQFRLNCQALEILQPDEKAVKADPTGQGYRMFSVANALALITNTADTSSLESWAEGEKRPEILEAIKKQHLEIESHIRAMREA